MIGENETLKTRKEANADLLLSGKAEKKEIIYTYRFETIRQQLVIILIHRIHNNRRS